MNKNKIIKRVKLELIVLTKINTLTICPLVERLHRREERRGTNAQLSNCIREVEKKKLSLEAHSKEQAIRMLFG